MEGRTVESELMGTHSPDGEMLNWVVRPTEEKKYRTLAVRLSAVQLQTLSRVLPAALAQKWLDLSLQSATSY